MFKKTVHELFRCKGSRLFVILMLVNFALSCVMPALNGGFVDFLVTNRDPSRVVWFAAFVAGIGDIGLLHVVCDGRERIARHLGDDDETDGDHV